jgi:hypothetical protein
MKANRLFFALPVLFAMVFSACESVKHEEVYVPAPEKEIVVTIKSPGAVIDLPETTRAVLQTGKESHAVLWETGDAMGVFTSDGATVNAQFTVDAVADNTGTFKGRFTPETTGTVSVYAYYPYNADAADPKAIPITIPALQSPGAGTLDPAACLLVGIPKSAAIDGKKLTMEEYGFKHSGVLVRLSALVDAVNSPTEDVSTSEPIRSITIEAPASKILSGDFTLDATTGTIKSSATQAEGANVMTFSFPDGVTVGNLNAFGVSAPFSLAAADELKITMQTEIYTIEKTLTGNEMNFVAGQALDLAISVDDECTITVDPDAPKHPAAPAVSYFSGSGTEFGETGQAMHKNSDTEFEIYTQLTADGVYGFSDEATGGIKYQLINNSLYTGTEGIPTPGDGIYYIKVNYATSTVTVQQLSSVRWWRCWGGAANTRTVELEYIGNGKWEGKGLYTKMGEDHSDNRYRFMATQAGTSLIWGYPAANHDPRPNPAPAGYYNISIRPEGTINQWDYAFKFASELMGGYVDIVLDMSPDAPAYTHSVTATAVTLTPAEPLTPVYGASVDLNEAGGSVEFTWTEAVSSLNSATYQILFYNGDNTLTPIATKGGTALTATTLTLANAELNAVANDGGLEDGATGLIYWSVVTTSGSAQGRSIRRPLSVTTIQTSIPKPTTLYISGAGTEYGAAISGAKAMRSLGDSKFEIYCRMTAGSTFRLTSGTSGDYATYGVTSGQITLGEASTTVATPATTSVYRVTADFILGTVTTQLIGQVWFERGFARAQDSKLLDYVGDGQWQYPSHTYADNDERYHFRVSYDLNGDPVADGGQWKEKWGNFTLDTQQRAQEWNINVMIGSANFGPEADWSYSFKLRERNPGTGVMNLYMNAATQYHEYIWQ